MAPSNLRIASLLPSATEIVCALGLEDRLVGVSHECDFPPRVASLPRLTRAKIDARGTSRAIHDDVRSLVSDGLGVYEIDSEALRAVAPDLIVTQDQCDVCAVSLADVEHAAREFLGTAATVVSLRPTIFDDIFGDIESVARAAGAEAAAGPVLEGLRARVEFVRKRTTAARYRPRVACIEWLDPLMAAGNWIPEIVAMAGGRYDTIAPGQLSEVRSLEQIAATDPEVVLLMPCGFGLEQTRGELASLTARPGWSDLQAVRNGRVYAVDGNAYLNRPGPRIVDSLELAGGLIQPGLLASRIPADSYFRV